MRKILGTQRPSGVFVNYQKTSTFNSGHRSIELPADKMVAATDRMMLRIQAGLRPLVTWECSEHFYSYTTTLRWSTATAQLQLEANADKLGIWFRLYPCLGGVSQRENVKSLASWSVRRCKNDLMCDNDYGNLHIHNILYQGPKPSDFTTAELDCDDPLFEGISRSESPHLSLWQARQPRPDLVENIITVTQQHINKILAAA